MVLFARHFSRQVQVGSLLLIGLILGAPFEQSLRQALLTSGGGYGIFVGSPITIGLVALIVLSLTISLILGRRKART